MSSFEEYPILAGTTAFQDESDKEEETKTCHLCGKAKCGQRKGRVKCCQCFRIFCLQQLQKKFNIKAMKDQKDFVCPRCRKICCCVTDCKLPPPHVHCKVLKVRQNKKKYKERAKLKQSKLKQETLIPANPVIKEDIYERSENNSFSLPQPNQSFLSIPPVVPNNYSFSSMNMDFGNVVFPFGNDDMCILHLFVFID